MTIQELGLGYYNFPLNHCSPQLQSTPRTHGVGLGDMPLGAGEGTGLRHGAGTVLMEPT